jgi:hypothetical protein
MLYNYYPKTQSTMSPDINPARRIFGNRFFSDQTINELLVEFLLVAFSSKKFAGGEVLEDTVIISPNILNSNSGKVLQYAPKARINLKLFSFLGVTRLEVRHQSHKNHYAHLVEELECRIKTNDNDTKDDIIRTMENLFLGFQGAGSGRGWSAQSFIPISPSFLACESIWKATEAQRNNVKEWSELFGNRINYFDHGQHNFLAKGGELLYLQLCNALSQDEQTIQSWNDKEKIGLTKNECNPNWLYEELNDSFKKLMDYCPQSLSQLADFIDTKVDPVTHILTDQPNNSPRYVNTGWCNADSWMEGYLFGTELLRILNAKLDIVDRIYLLESSCAFQAIRTLSTHSIRIFPSHNNSQMSYPGYRFIISSPDEGSKSIKRLSQQSVKYIEKVIYKAVRYDQDILPSEEKKRLSVLKQTDTKYGSKLFLNISKKLGFIIPKRGAGVRFVLNEQLMRLLVVTLLPVGNTRITYDTFKELAECRYGLVFDSRGMEKAYSFMNGRTIQISGNSDAWLQNMLEASGFLIHLSDSCAMIQNQTKHQE